MLSRFNKQKITYLKKITLVFFIIFLFLLNINWSGQLTWATVIAGNNPYQAKLLGKSNTVVNILPEKGYTFTLAYQNNGTETWLTNGPAAVRLKAMREKSDFSHPFWSAPDTPANLSHQVAPGERTTFRFALKAPPAVGLYNEKFVLAVGNNETVVGGSLVEILINVTLHPTAQAPTISPSSPAIVKQSPPAVIETNHEKRGQVLGVSDTVEEAATKKNPQSLNKDRLNWQTEVQPALTPINEPTIRVGLFYTFEPIELTANNLYFIKDTNDTLIETVGPGEKVTVVWQNKQYHLSTPASKRISLFPLRLTANNQDTIFTVTSYHETSRGRNLSGGGRFRGSLEIRYSSATNRLWLINELSLEDYLKGIAEISDISHQQAQKAIAVAARTYATRLYILGTKHADEFFTVDADFDQVYRGYNSEQKRPNFVQAVIATKGELITYQERIVLTPYFSQSDGRTRAWEEVWAGGPFAYLSSVAVPWDEGKTLLGHGVGMSVKAAINMANEGYSYLQILNYFYRQTLVKKFY